MTTPTSGSSEPTNWWRVVTPYATPIAAGSFAIIPAFPDLIAKSAQQKGQPISLTFMQCIREGTKAAPTIGVTVGAQMIIQRFAERLILGESTTTSWQSTIGSSAIVGAISAPFLAIINGRTMGWSARESMRRFTPRQGIAITAQETAFVGGIALADKLAIIMRQTFGENGAVDYAAAFIAGAVGSIAGHPANTALTRWQSGMTVESFRQSTQGWARKARAIGIFSVAYKCAKDTLNSLAKAESS